MFQGKNRKPQKFKKRNNFDNDKKSGFLIFFDKISSYFIILLCIILAFSLVKNISKVKSVERIIENKEMEVNSVREEQEELEKRVEYTQSQEYIEKQLRDNLGLAREGEIVVVMPPPEVLRKFAPKYEEDVDILPDPNWKQWLNLFI